MKNITDLGPEELLLMLAEEAAELAQACLKLRRALDKTNPTPRSPAECLENLIEEMADVDLCSVAFTECLGKKAADDIDAKRTKIFESKMRRWTRRLNDEEDDLK